MNNMNMAEKMTEGVAVSIMGFLIVFVVLLIIMGILSMFNLMAKLSEKNAAAAVNTNEPTVTSPQPVPSNENLADDTQLVAVIMAAIAAAEESSGNTKGTDGLVIKSIRRANAWNKEAINQNTNF